MSVGDENDPAGDMDEIADEIVDEAQLEDVLTTPRPELVTAIREIRSPLVIFGAGGKMGPTLAVLAKRAAEAADHPLQIVAVSRFSDAGKRRWLEKRGVRTHQADLLDRSSLGTLREAGDILYLVGLKFGTGQNPALTWAANALAPAHVAERLPGKRIVALSTGNVYPLTKVSAGGSREEDELVPLGEYANAAVARERIFEYFSRLPGGGPTALLRLNYATDLRYGVPVDLARKVWTGEAIDLRNGFFNCIWQGDANEFILRSFPLAESPARPWNLTAPGVLRVREVAERLGALLDREPVFSGTESGSAFLNNPDRLCAVLGAPPTSLDRILRWTAHWVKNDGPTLGKPTHFEVRDGAY